jgi:hypothetical protein
MRNLTLRILRHKEHNLATVILMWSMTVLRGLWWSLPRSLHGVTFQRTSPSSPWKPQISHFLVVICIFIQYWWPVSWVLYFCKRNSDFIYDKQVLMKSVKYNLIFIHNVSYSENDMNKNWVLPTTYDRLYTYSAKCNRNPFSDPEDENPGERTDRHCFPIMSLFHALCSKNLWNWKDKQRYTYLFYWGN